jgi:hypothetical protein
VTDGALHFKQTIMIIELRKPPMKAISPRKKKSPQPISAQSLHEALRGMDRFVDSVCKIVPVIRRRPVAKSA